MSDLLHPDELIRRMRSERRRCFVITGRPREGKTRLAQAMAKRYGGHYLNLLQTFADNLELSANVDTLTPQNFKAFLTGDNFPTSRPALMTPPGKFIFCEFVWLIKYWMSWYFDHKCGRVRIASDTD